jgi:hypothetical protein
MPCVGWRGFASNPRVAISEQRFVAADRIRKRTTANAILLGRSLARAETLEFEANPRHPAVNPAWAK